VLALLVVLAQVAVPPPRGYVNDFAGVLDSTSIAHMEAVIAEVRTATRGEIAVVTLSDIDDRPASEVALQIGRQWGVGDSGAAGDAAKNLGIVMLLVPRKNHQPGTGDIFIATGRGAEGFLTDAAVGRIRDAMLPALAQEQYGSALSLGVDLLAQAFATEFGVTLSSPEYVRPPPAQSPTRSFPISSIILLVVLLIIFSRGRILWLPFLLSGMRGSGWSSGRGGGWGGGRGGWGGGGGFGGFGGGGGFSGGGAGGRF
jgi:uncharacterized protein